MTLTYIKYAMSGIVAVAMLFFLYTKAQIADHDKHNEALSLISEFKQFDAILNQNIMELHQNILTYYDPTNDKLLKLQELQNKISENLHHMFPSNDKEIQKHLLLSQQAINKKSELLEGFKSSTALLRNSLHYLPLASTLLSAQLMGNTELQLKINDLLRDVLIYNLTIDPELENKITRLINIVKQEFKSDYTALQDDIDIFTTHIKIIIENKKLADDYVKQLLMVPTILRMNRLLDEYAVFHSQVTKTTNFYQQILYVFSLILVACVLYILLRLNKTASTLRKTVTDLNYQKFAMDQHAIVSFSDDKGDITYVNQKFCDLSQRSSEELIGQNHRISRSSYHSRNFYKNLWDTITSGKVWHGQIQNLAKDGSHFWVDTTIVPFLDENNKPYQYVAIRTDITQLKRIEEQLSVQAAALEAVSKGIVITDAKGNIEWVNKAFTEITGYSKQEAIGKTPKLYQSNRQSAEFYQHIWKTVLAGEIWQGELINQRKNGEQYPEELSISPLFDDTGKINHFIAISQDITERHLTEEALRRTQKMDALGKLTGGIAHDFNNMLGIILGYSELINEILHEKPITDATQTRLKSYIEEIQRTSQRGANLTQKLLSSSKEKPSSKEVVNLNHLLRDQEQMLKKTLTARIKLSYKLTDGIWPVELDANDLIDAILNMSINAMHAIDGTGEILIRTRNESIDELTAKTLQLAPGNYALLNISDTGSGMDAETKERIFEPFYTTKNQMGTGLGLAQVYGFVERSGGKIKVYSEPGKGTQFSLYFPKYERRQGNPDIPLSQSTAVTLDYSGHETILVVDDEPALLNLTAEILSQQGYNVLKAKSGKEALQLLANHKINLLFSDVIMPDMDGYQLAEIVSETYPATKIQLASGFTDNRQTSNALTQHVLHKPYSSENLLKKVRTLLNKSENLADNTLAKTILILDDDEDIRELFKLNLDKLGYNSVLSRNGEQALQYYQQQLDNKTPFAACILDLSIPDSMDGTAVAKKIRKIHPSAKIIVSSGHSAGPEMTRWHEHGFDAAIEKNFDRAEIKHVLEKLLG